MKKKSFFLLLFFITGLIIGSAQNTLAVSREAMLRQGKKSKAFSLSRLQETYAKTASLEADLVQEVYQESLGRTKTSSGSIRLSKPNKIRWETYKPEENIMVSNGSRLWYYNPQANQGKGQAIERSAREISQQPLYRILTGSANLEKEFKIEKTESIKGIAKNQDFTKLLLKPQKATGDLERVVLTINSKYLITEILLENTSGNHTKISLQNQKLGAKFPAVLFNFKPPPGTEILKQ